MRYLRGQRAPFVVPAVVVLGIAAGAIAPVASGASSPPTLPTVTPAQLVSEVLSAKPPQLSGQLTWTANLGLGDLASAADELGAGSGPPGGAFNPVSLLNGSYQVDVWLDGAKAEHLSTSPQPGEEMDFVRNGDQAWTWDSSTMKVQHYTWSAHEPPATSTNTVTSVPETPQAVAQRILEAAGKTTSVTVAGTTWVGGLPTYELLLTPKGSPATTVDHIEIDVSASSALPGIPLEVALYASGQASPALALGFSSGIQTGAPPVSELTFATPPGATVKNHQLGADAHAEHAAKATGSAAGSRAPGVPHSIGSGWATVWTGTTSALDNPRYQQALDATTTIVTVAGTQARLFSSALVNVLVLPSGRYYAGLVTPAYLESEAANAAGA